MGPVASDTTGGPEVGVVGGGMTAGSPTVVSVTTGTFANGSFGAFFFGGAGGRTLYRVLTTGMWIVTR